MSHAGDICWTRSYRGRNPSRVLIAGEYVAFSYVDDQGPPGSPGRERLVCLDLNGNERWSARDFQLHAAAGERLVGTTEVGELRVVDLDGHK